MFNPDVLAIDSEMPIMFNPDVLAIDSEMPIMLNPDVPAVDSEMPIMFNPDVPARDSEMPVMTMCVASERGRQISLELDCLVHSCSRDAPGCRVWTCPTAAAWPGAGSARRCGRCRRR